MYGIMACMCDMCDDGVRGCKIDSTMRCPFHVLPTLITPQPHHHHQPTPPPPHPHPPRGLQSIHEELGAAHSDLKPQNVLLDHKLGVHISDFGALKALGSDKQVAVEAYTLAYCAPEQAEEQGGLLSTASDVWALGYIAVELLVGRRAWKPRQAPDWDALPAHVPRDLVDTLKQCFHFEPDRRCTARDVAEALEEALRAAHGNPRLQLPAQMPSGLKAFWKAEVKGGGDGGGWGQALTHSLTHTHSPPSIAALLRHGPRPLGHLPHRPAPPGPEPPQGLHGAGPGQRGGGRGAAADAGRGAERAQEGPLPG